MFYQSMVYGAMFVAILLPYICIVFAKSGGFDNANPRESLQKLTGWRARANAAHANSFEALPFFLSSVLLALHLGANIQLLGLWAAAFVVLRILYIYSYISKQSTLRTFIWVLAFLSNCVIFFLGICK